MTSQEYAKELVKDYILESPMSSLELEMRLDNLILLAQNEGLGKGIEIIGQQITEPTT